MEDIMSQATRQQDRGSPTRNESTERIRLAVENEFSQNENQTQIDQQLAHN